MFNLKKNKWGKGGGGEQNTHRTVQLYYRPGQPNADSTKNVLLLKNPQF